MWIICCQECSNFWKPCFSSCFLYLFIWKHESLLWKIPPEITVLNFISVVVPIINNLIYYNNLSWCSMQLYFDVVYLYYEQNYLSNYRDVNFYSDLILSHLCKFGHVFQEVSTFSCIEYFDRNNNNLIHDKFSLQLVPLFAQSVVTGIGFIICSYACNHCKWSLKDGCSNISSLLDHPFL